MDLTGVSGPIQGSRNGCGIVRTGGLFAAQLVNAIAPSRQHIVGHRRLSLWGFLDPNGCIITLFPNDNGPVVIRLQGLQGPLISFGLGYGVRSPQTLHMGLSVSPYSPRPCNQDKGNLSDDEILLQLIMSLTSAAVWIASRLIRVRSTSVAPAM